MNTHPIMESEDIIKSQQQEILLLKNKIADLQQILLSESELAQQIVTEWFSFFPTTKNKLTSFVTNIANRKIN